MQILGALGVFWYFCFSRHIKSYLRYRKKGRSLPFSKRSHGAINQKSSMSRERLEQRSKKAATTEVVFVFFFKCNRLLDLRWLLLGYLAVRRRHRAPEGLDPAAEGVPVAGPGAGTGSGLGFWSGEARGGARCGSAPRAFFGSRGNGQLLSNVRLARVEASRCAGNT